MKYFIICGEHSADLYGAKLMEFIQEEDSQAEFCFSGGENMERTVGSGSVIPLENMNFMGFLEVAKNLRLIKKNFSIIRKTIMEFQPHALILLDYPGFNLRIARWAFKVLEGRTKIFYFISPTVWAWKKSRAFYIQRFCRKLFVILPFEKEFYARKGIGNVEFVGHPLVEEIKRFKNQPGRIGKHVCESDFRRVLIMPGSRVQEVKKHLSVMASVAKEFTRVEFVVSAMKSIPEKYYEPALQYGVRISYEPSLQLMLQADAAILKSGTSSLQAALMGLPHMVCYRAHPLSYFIAKQLVKVKYISLINIIPDKKIVEEFIQGSFRPVNLTNELKKLLYDGAYSESIKKNFSSVEHELHPFSEHPCRKVAMEIIRDLKS